MMKDYTEYKREIDRFKNDCRLYYAHETSYLKMQAEYPWIVDESTYPKHNLPRDKAVIDRYRNTRFECSRIERIFERIEENCGLSGRILVWRQYVDDVPLEALTAEYEINKRQFTYLTKKWLYETFRQMRQSGEEI